jgi:hypothetical protein
MLPSGRGTWTTRILVILALIVAYYAGSLRAGVSYHTAVPSSAEGAVSIEADGWTYGLDAPDGVAWTDAHGSFHEGGRPDCLPATGTTEVVRFAAVEVTIEGGTWRPIVWVDCR